MQKANRAASARTSLGKLVDYSGVPSSSTPPTSHLSVRRAEEMAIELFPLRDEQAGRYGLANKSNRQKEGG
jgi:hypothetical protein